MNKKILAILMALLMVLMSSVAFADDTAAPTLDESFKNESGSKSFKIVKSYSTGDVSTDFVPEETLTFNATYKKYESTTSDAANEPTTIPAFAGSLKVTAAGNYNVEISSTTDFIAAGRYFYELSETKPVDGEKVQGVTYGEQKINFVVTVGYDEQTGNLKVLDVGVVKVDNKKNGTITNKYDVGGVNISKTVSGNAANLNDTFKATVTITAAAGKKLPNNFDIYFTDIENQATAKKVSLTKDAATFDVTLKQGTNVVITNLPDGAIVNVAENDDKVNTEKETDATKYTASYENNGVAAAASAQTIKVTNTRTTTIDTGVNTDSMPYIMLMAFVMMLAAAVVLKKRTVND